MTKNDFSFLFSSSRLRILSIFICIVIFATSILNIKNLSLDASSDALMIKGSESLEYYNEIKQRYGSDNFLAISYTPKEGLFSRNGIQGLKKLYEELSTEYSNITSILDVPLVFKGQLMELAPNNAITLNNSDLELSEVKQLLINNHLYKDLLIDRYGKSANIIIHFPDDYNASEEDDIKEIKQIANKYKNDAEIYFGGLPVIMHDSMEYVSSDISSFSFVVIIIITAILLVFFRDIKWMILSALTALMTIATILGFLAIINWPITVVSSNIVALLLISSLSVSIHYIIKYNQILLSFPSIGKVDASNKSMLSVIKPCFYTTITTMVAFSSLVLSQIKPVMDFGWMMTIGVAIAFSYNFFFLVPISSFLKFTPKESHFLLKKIPNILAYISLNYPRRNIILAVLVTIISIFGVLNLTVENRFIDYFKENTEISKGMYFLDKNFGGTTPLEIIISSPDKEENYWDSFYNHEKVKIIHDILESQSEIGKVLSYESTLSLLREIENTDELDSFTLRIIEKKAPKYLKEILFEPYISYKKDELRFSARVYETSKDLRRSELIDRIKKQIIEETSLSKEDIRISGMLVLYNEVLSSLFDSQIKTISYVFIAIFLMFLFAFKNFKLATIGILVNVISCLTVLGIMGHFSIPLDIMTIGVASICIGIAVDDTIHYSFRFKENIRNNLEYAGAVLESHNSTGKAMFLTSLVISLGFLALAFSNFVPTIYFGLLTGLAMIIGFLVNMTLLPLMLKLIYKNSSRF